VSDERPVQFRSDGLGLSPAAYGRLLAEIADTRGIATDDYSRGGVVAELETRMAALLGKEAAVFLPTGTLANHLAVRLLARRGRRVLVQAESHLYNDEGDCAQTLSGLNLVPLSLGRATVTLAEIERAAAGAPDARVAVPAGIGLHLDGARLLLEAAYSGVAPAETAALFDTVYVSLWKYLNAANGAILAGPRDLLDGLYHQRRMFGGSLPHAWPCAAVALHFLDGFAERFAAAVRAADAVFEGLRGHPLATIERGRAATNVAILRVTGAEAATLPQRLAARGIGIRPPFRASATAAEFTLHTNETILSRPAAEIVENFVGALEE
jgi:threonine aldolase